MRKVILFTGLIALSGMLACGQTETKVSATVKTAFSEKFPGATKVKWDMENENEWEAEFRLDGKKYSANFDNTGAWTETEYEITSDALPETVKACLKRQFESYYKVEEIEVVESPEGTVYEIEIKKGRSEMEVTISASGSILEEGLPAEEEGDEEGDKD